MKRRYIWLIEIIVWIFIISIGLFSIIYNTAIKDNTKNSYYIFLDDAGGLVQGSPVRLMGITIGYIKDVKIFDNKVFISFLITEKGTQLPKRSIANVEFYGLGGSTSLEIMPQVPTKDDREIIIPTKTYRVQDFWHGSELVSNVLIDIYGGAGRSIEKANLIENKHLFKQSDLIKAISGQTESVNTAQTVIIYKFTSNTFKYIENKNRQLLELSEKEDEKLQKEEQEKLQTEDKNEQ